MDVLEFVKEFKRLCESHPNCDAECPFRRQCPTLTTLSLDDVETLKRWAKEHPANMYCIFVDEAMCFEYADKQEALQQVDKIIDNYQQNENLPYLDLQEDLWEIWNDNGIEHKISLISK